MFIIGTAGHIDHGKSSLIIKLTGIDPDRLPEEKARGMTIDLGFAFYDTADGRRIGIVDVPGHERFVRNMIAGVGGIDAVVLVVAADDGWMPQSQEHFQITRLLGICDGLIALTKIDLVEPGWVDLVTEDIREKVRGTFLEKAPIIPVSSTGGEGFERLRSELEKLAARMVDRGDIGKPRLYIDRSFVISGMGGIVTGTLRGGGLVVGGEAAVFPDRRVGRVRTLQSHNLRVEKAEPGQRTAVSLTGIDKEYLKRGAVISTPQIVNNYPDSTILALSLEMLAEAPVIIRDGRRLLLIVGTTEVEGEVRVFDRGTLTPGQSGLVFFKPFEPVLTFVGDRYIVRLPTPAVTIGGGTVLDILDRFPRQKHMAGLAYLRERTDVSTETLIETELVKKGAVEPEIDFLFTNLPLSEAVSGVQKLAAAGRLVKQGPRYYEESRVADISRGFIEIMREAFKQRPHLNGLPVEQITAAGDRRRAATTPVLELMISRGELVRKGNLYDLPGREVTVTGELKKAADNLEQRLSDGALAPERLNDLVGGDRVKKEAMEYLILVGRAVKVSPDIAFHATHWERALKIIGEMLKKGEDLTVAALRERLDSTRKFVVPLLEETDRRKITRREGDIRVKGDSFG